MSAMTLEIQVPIPGHRCDGTMKKGMGVMQEAREARVLLRRQAASRRTGPIERKNFEPAAREVGLENQGVVSSSENDAIILITHGRLLHHPGGVGVRPPAEGASNARRE